MEEEHACLYWAVQELYKQGITNIDAFNLSNMLQSHSAVNRLIGKYNMPSTAEIITEYLKITRESVEELVSLSNIVITYAFKRALVKELGIIENRCFSTVDLAQLSTLTYNALDDLTQKFILGGDNSTFGDRIDDIWAEIEYTAENGIRSKYPILDNYFRYEPGEVVCIQARTKKGKSVFLMNEAVHKLKQGIPTFVYDTEMSDRLYTQRLLSHLTGIPIKKIKEKTYTSEEYDRLRQQMEVIKKWPFEHIYDPEMDMQRLFAKCRTLKNSMGLSFFVFDYLKSNVGSSSENYNVLGAKADFLKNDIAGRLELPVLTACQLNRNEQTADSEKINNYLSTCAYWQPKTQEQVVRDGIECGNMRLKIFANRNGEQMSVDDENEYLDFHLDGKRATITEAKQHEVDDSF